MATMLVRRKPLLLLMLLLLRLRLRLRYRRRMSIGCLCHKGIFLCIKRTPITGSRVEKGICCLSDLNRG